jgi:hypothetical protein
MYASPFGDVSRRCTFEAIFGKGLDSGIEQFLLGNNAALLLFSGRFIRHLTSFF